MKSDNPFIDEFGNKWWLKNNLPHNTKGPAIIYTDGSLEYWVNGKLSRKRGPAVIWQDGYKEWWINGRCIKFGRGKDIKLFKR